MKACTRCGTARDLSEFPLKPSARDGRKSECKLCVAEYQREYRKNNAAKLLAQKVEYYTRKRDEILRQREVYRIINPNANKEYHVANKDRIANRKMKWRIANIDRIRASLAERMAHDPDRFKSYFSEWRRNNKHLVTAAGARRRARRAMATPVWADARKIAAFYESAEALRMLLGEWYEVDHIVPLQSERVCGLHNEFNLQILTMTENRRKSNRYD